jgi:threonylcarbamoyladenosine tRNA methylthiotransferase MtaB
VDSFYVENFGCRATQADGAAIETEFRERGLVRAEKATRAQIVVLNTCTVTASADRDARAAIRRIHRENPSCQIVVTGCYAQRAPEEIAVLPGVTQVVGNSHKHILSSIVSPQASRQSSIASRKSPEAQISHGEFVSLSQLLSAPAPHRSLTTEVYVSDIFAHTQLLAAPVFDASNERTRPNLKVQDGCDNRCSFCVIPYVRGQSRSLPLDRILREVNALVSAGYREVVISGINLGRWGRDLPGGQQFEHLVRAILSETLLEKLRISSVEPMDWTDELIGLFAACSRIAKHAHVPLQSGNDRILRAMHRKYRPWHYENKIRKIRHAMPTAAIGADVMVGFPGESDADFDETRRLIESLPFTYLHVFTYSARPGTPASSMRNQVPVHIARERNHILRNLASAKKLEFMRSFVSKSVQAITLKVSNGGFTEALTENYLPLTMVGQHEANRWITAQVNGLRDGALFSSTV